MLSVGVDHVAPEFDSPVPLQRLRHHVLVNLDLCGVAGSVLPCLGVDGDGLVACDRDEVRFPGQGRGAPPEPETVLVFAVDLRIPIPHGSPFPCSPAPCGPASTGSGRSRTGASPSPGGGLGTSQPTSSGLLLRAVLRARSSTDTGAPGAGHGRRSSGDGWAKRGLPSSLATWQRAPSRPEFQRGVPVSLLPLPSGPPVSGRVVWPGNLSFHRRILTNLARKPPGYPCLLHNHELSSSWFVLFWIQVDGPDFGSANLSPMSATGWKRLMNVPLYR